MTRSHSVMGLLLVGIAATLGVIPGALPASASTAHHATYFEKNTSSTSSKTGLEFTDVLFKGNHRQHAGDYTASDHFKCTFTDNKPSCNGQIAIGDSMLLIHGRGGLGTFTIPIVGGTGKFRGANGTLKVHDLAHDNADLTLNYTY